MDKVNLRPFLADLRELGFDKTSDSQFGGERTVIFHRTDGARRIEVQLWGDGSHRASHYISGRMTTLPTDFVSIEGMLATIDREFTRMDNANIKDTPK